MSRGVNFFLLLSLWSLSVFLFQRNLKVLNFNVAHKTNHYFQNQTSNDHEHRNNMKWVNLLSWSLLFISSFALAESDSKHKHQQRRHDSNVYLLSNGKVVSNDDTTLLTKHEAMTYLDTFWNLMNHMSNWVIIIN